jgi:hypothetical protein
MSVHEANMRAALESHYVRTHYKSVVEDMPFDEMLSRESDGVDGEIGEYEMAQRRAAIKGLFRYLLAEGNHPLKLMKRLYAVGVGLCIDEFSGMTNEERGMMFGESKAAVSWRIKFLSGLIRRSGMRGVKLPGQKSPESAAVYAQVQKGNSNRRKK